MGRLFGGNALRLVSNLVDGGALDEQEIEELSRMLDEAKRRGRE